MRLFDSHCHLESAVLFDRIDSVYQEARKAGVEGMLTAAVSPSQWARSKQLASTHSGIHYAVGVHPWFAEPLHRQSISEVMPYLYNDAAAVGETGLDRMISHPSFELQKELFIQQLRYARDSELPVVLHCRKAHNETIEILKNHAPLKAGGILHGFDGSEELARQYMDLNISLSLGSRMTREGGKHRISMLHAIYPAHIVLETDSPDMPPEGHEKPNKPSNLPLIAKAVSLQLDLPVERIAQITTDRARQIFRISEND